MADKNIKTLYLALSVIAAILSGAFVIAAFMSAFADALPSALGLSMLSLLLAAVTFAWPATYPELDYQAVADLAVARPSDPEAIILGPHSLVAPEAPQDASGGPQGLAKPSDGTSSTAGDSSGSEGGSGTRVDAARVLADASSVEDVEGWFRTLSPSRLEVETALYSGRVGVAGLEWIIDHYPSLRADARELLSARR